MWYEDGDKLPQGQQFLEPFLALRCRVAVATSVFITLRFSFSAL